jgi:hypothetical protein
MPNVAEVIRDHVTLTVECVDRLYLNGYVPGLQREAGVVTFLRRAGANHCLAGPVRSSGCRVSGGPGDLLPSTGDPLARVCQGGAQG